MGERVDFFEYIEAKHAEALFAAALDYAARGWPVFPCQPDGKAPATHHGLHDATTDENLIRGWWRRVPLANVAIATGAPAVDVLDVDVYDDVKGERASGFPAFHRARRAGLLAGSRALVSTPSGGMHAHYAGTEQRCGALKRHFLDFKAAGGYVLAPPSRVDDHPYQWVEHQDVEPVALDWPAIKKLLDPPTTRFGTTPSGSGGNGSVAGLVRSVRDAPEGSRNNVLYWAACRAAETGDVVALEALARAGVAAGLPEIEARRTVSSAAKRMEGNG